MVRKIAACFIGVLTMTTMHAQNTYEGRYSRPLADVARDVEQRFGIKLRFDMDTTGLIITYADFRVRPWSVEQTLTNICAYYDWNWWPRAGRLYRISRYEYYRRHQDEGRQMLEWLSAKYNDRTQWEQRRQLLIDEVRQRLCIDAFLDSCSRDAKPVLGKVLHHDGYTTQNICLQLMPGLHVFGTIYQPAGSRHAKGKKKQHFPLIICPDGHWPSRYRDDEQQRLATLARMGAVCADFDLYGYGQSKDEVGSHSTPRAHIVQAASGIRLLDHLLSTMTNIDTTRIGICGGSGGGTHTVLLALLAEAHNSRPLPALQQARLPRIAAIAPVVHLASHFDGGCPCESGMPVQLSAGGTCEPELAAIFAPRPMLVVSDGGDWTATVPELEMPFMQRIYAFYGAKDSITNVHLPDERHDFGPSKRQAVYDFFARIFNLQRDRADESRVTLLPPEKLQSEIPL